MVHTLIFIYLIVGAIRDRVKSTRPFTQFMMVFVLAVPYVFLDLLFNEGGSVSQRIFMCWPTIFLLAILNGLAGMLVFRGLARLPVKVVLESERRGF